MDTNKIYADQLLRNALNWCQPDVPGRLREAFEAGADPDDFGALLPGSNSALGKAIAKHDPEAVAVILEFGADPNGAISRDYYVITAMQLADGNASDGVRFGRPWAEKALEIQRIMAAALRV